MIIMPHIPYKKVLAGTSIVIAIITIAYYTMVGLIWTDFVWGCTF